MPDQANLPTNDSVIEAAGDPSRSGNHAAPVTDDEAAPDSPGNGQAPAPKPARATEPASSREPNDPVDPPLAPAAEDELASYFGLRRNDQFVVVMLASAIVVFSGLRWADMSGWGTRPIEIDRPPDKEYAFQLDPNTANWIEWMQLPDIGETLARRIVEDREQRGPFHSLGDLDRVDGIGPRTIERIRPWLREPSPPDPALPEVP